MTGVSTGLQDEAGRLRLNRGCRRGILFRGLASRAGCLCPFSVGVADDLVSPALVVRSEASPLATSVSVRSIACGVQSAVVECAIVGFEADDCEGLDCLVVLLRSMGRSRKPPQWRLALLGLPAGSGCGRIGSSECRAAP